MGNRRWAGLAAFAFVIAIGIAGLPTAKAEPPVGSDGKLDVLCSFFPVYLFTKNVVGDVPNVNVSLMLPAEMGCPHDYDLTPADQKRLAAADLFVINGGGLEEFSDKQLKSANPRMTVVDSAVGIKMIAGTCSCCKKGHDHDHDAVGDPKKQVTVKGKEEHDHDHDHDHGLGNPHFFSSPAHAAKQTKNIAEALAKADPANAAKYRANADAFAGRLNALAKEFQATSTKHFNAKIVTMHEIFDYLAKDAGLDVIGTIQSAPGRDPSAGEMREIITALKAEKPSAIFTEPQYPEKVAKVIAKEAGVPLYSLDPIATGPADAKADYYEVKMRENLESLQKALAGSTP